MTKILRFGGDLGVGAEAAMTIGQVLLLERLDQPESDVQEALLALLMMKLSTPQGEWEMTKAFYSQLHSVFGLVLTPQDWDDIAKAAAKAVQQQVKQPLKLPKPA